MKAEVEIIQTDADIKSFDTGAESEKVPIKYYPLSVSTFACFPSILVEGVEIDGTDV